LWRCPKTDNDFTGSTFGRIENHLANSKGACEIDIPFARLQSIHAAASSFRFTPSHDPATRHTGPRWHGRGHRRLDIFPRSVPTLRASLPQFPRHVGDRHTSMWTSPKNVTQAGRDIFANLARA